MVFRYRSLATRIGGGVSAVSLGLLILAWLRLGHTRPPDGKAPAA